MEEDDNKGDVFECKVGNLPPKTQAKVTFSYITQCQVTEGEQGTTTFTYPCVLGPRYNISPEKDKVTGTWDVFHLLCYIEKLLTMAELNALHTY